MVLPETLMVSMQPKPIIEYCAHLSPPSTDSNKKLFFWSAIFEYKDNGVSSGAETFLLIGRTVKLSSLKLLYSSFAIIRLIFRD